MKLFLVLLVAVIFVGANANSNMRYPRCQQNEEFRSCGTACEPSCQDPEPSICTLQCIVNVCQCRRGFVRGPSGCIRQSQCPVYGK